MLRLTDLTKIQQETDTDHLRKRMQTTLRKRKAFFNGKSMEKIDKDLMTVLKSLA